jgi:hypothetical protein
MAGTLIMSLFRKFKAYYVMIHVQVIHFSSPVILEL